MAAGATVDNIIIERFHGKIPDREEYQRLKTQFLKPGDTLVIYDLEALGGKRSAKNELEYYKAHNIHVKIVDIPTTAIDYHGSGQRPGSAFCGFVLSRGQ